MMKAHSRRGAREQYALFFLIVFFVISPIWSVAASSFWDGSEERLLELIDRAERELKVFVYPFPPTARRCDMSRGGYIHQASMPKQMFQMELLLPEYLQKHSLVSTLNGSEADLFMVNHEWICLRIANEETHWRRDKKRTGGINKWTGEAIAVEHLKPIFDSVLIDYPYYNRSGGKDHFMTMIYDNGPFCGSSHLKPSSPLVLPIMKLMSPMILIQNNGYSGLNELRMHAEGGESGDAAVLAAHPFRVGKDKIACFRQDQDIVIPQAHEWYHESRSPHPSPSSSAAFKREGNIFFRGDLDDGLDCSPGVRSKIREAHEWLKQRQDGTSQDMLKHFVFQESDMSSSYFALCPARMACWSMRLYDAISHETIPVIMADPIIEPFERFLNWSSFSIKYQTHETASYAHEGKKYVVTDMHKPTKFHETFIAQLSAMGNEARTTGSGLVMQKLQAIRSVAPWLSFMCPPQAQKCAYRLVIAELWCRTSKGMNAAACARPTSNIAFKEYF